MDTHFSGIQNVEGSKNVPKSTWSSVYLEFAMSEIICIGEAGRVRRSPFPPSPSVFTGSTPAWGSFLSAPWNAPHNFTSLNLILSVSVLLHLKAFWRSNLLRNASKTRHLLHAKWHISGYFLSAELPNTCSMYCKPSNDKRCCNIFCRYTGLKHHRQMFAPYFESAQMKSRTRKLQTPPWTDQAASAARRGYLQCDFRFPNPHTSSYHLRMYTMLFHVTSKSKSTNQNEQFETTIDDWNKRRSFSGCDNHFNVQDTECT